MKNSSKVEIEAEKAKVKSVVDQFAQFWETKDMELLSRIMAPDTDMVNYGSDAPEYFVGWEMLRGSVEKMLPSLQNIRITVRDQVTKVHHSGEVAWFSEVWDWDLVVEGKPVRSEGQRLTGVLEKRSGNWVFVQFHNSVPVR
jgi:uncharacterized protein (TIGR02246 family)